MSIPGLCHVKERFPAIYDLIVGFYFRLRWCVDKLFGTKFNTLIWKHKGMVEIHLNSIHHPHREFLLSQISKQGPFNKFFEFGCNVGPNLYRLSNDYPSGSFEGIDVNSEAIQVGIDWFKKDGLSNVRLSVGDESFFDKLETSTYDIVLADAVLMYIGPEKILRLAKHLFRVARKCVIVVDWHSEGVSATGNYHLGKWVRDYRALFHQISPHCGISTLRIPPEVWGGPWAKFGNVIVVKKIEEGLSLKP